MARQPLHRVVGEQRCEESERYIDPEDQRPMQVLGNGAAKDRSCDTGHDPRSAHVSLVSAALARRDHVGDGGLRERHDAAAPDTLQRSTCNEDGHVGCRCAQGRTHDEQADRQQHHAAAPGNVGELAVERRDYRRRQQIGNDDPGQILEIAELASDGGQGRGDDGLIEGRQEHPEHQTIEDIAHVGLGQPWARRGKHGLGFGSLLRVSARGRHSSASYGARTSPTQWSHGQSRYDAAPSAFVLAASNSGSDRGTCQKSYRDPLAPGRGRRKGASSSRRIDASAPIRQAMAAAKTHRKLSAAPAPASTVSAEMPRTIGPPASTMAAKPETIKAEPRARKKFMVPVAMPSWCNPTPFCTTTTVNGNIGPNPRPTSAIRPSAAEGASSVGAIASGTSAAIESKRPTSGTRL